MTTTISSKLPQGYDPLQDPVYMSADMRYYFKEKLSQRLEALINAKKMATLNKDDYSAREADHVDQGKVTEAKAQEMLDIEHDEYAKSELQNALHRIEMGIYGYCEATGEPIGIRRLLAFTMARHSIRIQKGKESLYRR